MLSRSLCVAGAIGAVLICAPSLAQSTGLLDAAVERHQSVSLHNWRFDRVRTVEGLEVRERCVGIDYRKAECRLRFVDGQPPDEKALKRYQKNVPQPVENNLPNVDPGKYINPDTAEGNGESEGVARYRFEAASESGDEQFADGQHRGEVRVDRDAGYVRSLRMANSVPFKVATGVRIKRFEIRFDFVEIDDAVMAARVEMQAQGRAFGLKKIEQKETFVFENFVAPY